MQGGNSVPCDRAQTLPPCNRLFKSKRLIFPRGFCLEVLRMSDYSPGQFVNPLAAGRSKAQAP